MGWDTQYIVPFGCEGSAIGGVQATNGQRTPARLPNGQRPSSNIIAHKDKNVDGNGYTYRIRKRMAVGR
jgi:hypothetical protein